MERNMFSIVYGAVPVQYILQGYTYKIREDNTLSLLKKIFSIKTMQINGIHQLPWSTVSIV